MSELFDEVDEEVRREHGGGLLRGLAQRLSRETKVPVELVDAPLECVVLGAGHCIEHYDALKGIFMGARR